MTTTLLLALRNLLRNRRRSLATLLAMAIGSSAILLFGGYSKNIAYSMESAYVRTGGHLQIQHRDFYVFGSGNPVAYGIADDQAILAAIGRDPVLRSMVLVATPMLQFGGIAGNYAAGVSRTVIGVGLVAPQIERMRQWNDYDIRLELPTFPLLASAPDAAVIGNGVARVLQLCKPLGVGDCPQPEAVPDATDGTSHGGAAAALPDDIAALSARETDDAVTFAAAAAASGAKERTPHIELLASNARGTPNVAALDIIRAESQGFKELDEVLVLLHLKQAQRLVFGKEAPRVTSVMVQLRHSSQLEAARARLLQLLPAVATRQPVTVLDFRVLNPFFTQTLELFDTIFSFIFVLIGGIVLFTVGNTMNTAVVERTVEIGTLRAIGLRRGGIRALFVTEGLLLGLVGAVLGVVCALVAAFVVNQLGLTWLPPGSAQRLPLELRVWGEWKMIVGTTVGLIVIATFSAWWPAYRAARLPVVDALRHV